MHASSNRNSGSGDFGEKRFDRQASRHGWRALACLAAMAFLTCTAPSGQQAPSPDEVKQQPAPAAGPRPDSDRAKQVAEDSAKLLKLATELKIEVDKTTKGTLSLAVIQKAEAIEKLAHSTREKVKLNMRPGQ